MAREMMWVCAIAPEKFRERVTQLCLAENVNIGMPENVFKLPLHISLKKSFYTEDFDSVKDDILKMVNSIGRFCCYIDKIDLHRDMLWLSLINDGKLHYLHEKLNRLLETKYDIPISTYDQTFHPHISLFTRGTQEQMRMMFNRLKGQEFGRELEISQLVIGASGHGDIFYNT